MAMAKVNRAKNFYYPEGKLPFAMRLILEM